MAVLLHRLRIALIGITAVSLILLAVLVTVLRLVLPMASDYREQVAGELGAMLGHRVEIGALDARWRLLGPRVYLDAVSILDGDSDTPLLEVKRLDLGVRVWRSLWQGQLRFHSVRVLGADVHVDRGTDGRIKVSGAGVTALEEAADERQGGTRLVEMLAGTTFRLQSSRLRYTDQVLGLDYRFDDLNMGVAVDTAALRLAGQVFLPPELGHALTVGVDLRGDPDTPGTWRGNVHVRGNGILIEGLPDRSLARRVNATQGILDLELWGRVVDGRLDRARALVRGSDVHLGAIPALEGESRPPVHLESVAADALWEKRGEDGWQLRLHEARMRHPGKPEVEMGLSLAYREVDGERRVWGEGNGLRLEYLLPVLLSQDRLSEAHRTWLAELSPAGEMPEIHFHGRLPESGEPWFSASGEFHELALQPHERIPGFQGLSGGFSIFSDGGEVTLGSRNLRLDFPRLFADSLWLTALEGRLSWVRSDDGFRLTGERLRLHNEDLRAEGRLEMDLGSEPAMDLMVDFADGDGSRTGRYLPVGIMPANTVRWLKQSIVQGRVQEGRLVFRGPLTRFPLAEDEGIFEVRARVVDGVLDYQPGWPAIRELAGELIFDDRGMRAESASGRLFDAHVDGASVRIGDYQAAVLEVDGQVRGPLQDMLRYVRESPLARGLDGLLDDTRAEGDSRLSLSLVLPLHRRAGGPAAARVRGAVDLDGNRLRLAGHPVDFRQIKGQVRFTEATVEAERVTARFNDESVNLDARKPAGETLTVRAEGAQQVSALADQVPGFLRPHLRGRSRWTAELTVPAGGGATRLSLESMLQGVTSDLPEPLAKAAETPLPLRIVVPLTGAQSEVRIRVGSTLSAALRPDGSRGELRFNDGDARLPDAGLRLAGRLDRLDLDAWQKVMAGGAGTDSTIQAAGTRLSSLELRVGELSWGRHQLREVYVNADRGRDRWQAWVDAPALRGQVDIPRDFTGSAPLTVNLEVLDLDFMAKPGVEGQPGDVAGGQRLDPRLLPGLRGAIAQLRHGGRSFSDVRIEATRIRDGLQFHHVQAATAGGHATVRVTGDWRVPGGDRHQTQLRFDVTTEHLGRMLSDLGFEHGFDRGSGRLEGQLRWPDAPTRFTWQGLQGTGRVEIDNGRLVEVEPGAGRLLGLFSLNMLPRRLALDFRDVFQRGFTFDKLSGTIRLVEGDAYTSDLAIRGSAARIGIEGRTGLAARDHDLRVVVTPRVGSTLPVAGAILGGPVAGAAVFILDRVLGMGRGIDEAARVEYRITGPWQEPLVETIARPVARPQ